MTINCDMPLILPGPMKSWKKKQNDSIFSRAEEKKNKTKQNTLIIAEIHFAGFYLKYFGG